MSGPQPPYRPATGPLSRCRLGLSASQPSVTCKYIRDPPITTIHMSPLEGGKKGRGGGKRREGTREGRKEDVKSAEIKGASVLRSGVLSGEAKRKKSINGSQHAPQNQSRGCSVGLREHTLLWIQHGFCLFHIL